MGSWVRGRVRVGGSLHAAGVGVLVMIGGENGRDSGRARNCGLCLCLPDI
jgi:hypothetical protein